MDVPGGEKPGGCISCSERCCVVVEKLLKPEFEQRFQRFENKM